MFSGKIGLNRRRLNATMGSPYKMHNMHTPNVYTKRTREEITNGLENTEELCNSYRYSEV